VRRFKKIRTCHTDPVAFRVRSTAPEISSGVNYRQCETWLESWGIRSWPGAPVASNVCTRLQFDQPPLFSSEAKVTEKLNVATDQLASAVSALRRNGPKSASCDFSGDISDAPIIDRLSIGYIEMG